GRGVGGGAVLPRALGGWPMPSWGPFWAGGPTGPAEPAKPLAATSPVPLRPNAPANPAAPDASVTDRVLAIVNNDAITLSDLQEAIAVYQYENRDRAPAPANELAPQFLTRMIE